MKDKEEFFLAPSENIEGKKDKKLWYWEECMKIAAESGAKLGSLVFWVVYKISVYEEHGKFDFCTAGPARLAEDLGVSEKQIRWALQRACSTSVWQGKEKKPKEQQLYHIFCSQRVYRNKTDIYVTKHWLEKHNIKPDKISILAHNKHPEQRLDREDGRYKILPVEGELVEKSVVLNDEDVNETTSKGVDFDETTPKSVDTTPKSVVGIEVGLNQNKLKRMSESLNELKSSKEEEQAPKNASFQSEDFEEEQKTSKQTKPLKEKQEPIDNIDRLKGLKKKSSKKQKSPNQQITLIEAEDSRVKDEEGRVAGGNVLVERAYALWEEILGQPCKRDKWNSQAAWNMMRAKAKGEEWLRGMLMIVRECKKDPKADFRTKNIANLADLQKNWEYAMDWYRQQRFSKSKSKVIRL